MRDGHSNRHLYIFVLILVSLAILRLGMVLAAGIDTVNLLLPANKTHTNQTNDTIVFEFNYTGENETAVCVLYIKNSTSEFVAVNQTSTSNASNATLMSNISIEEGVRQWYVNCTNETETNQSFIYTLTVDWTKPFAKINRPLNSTVNSDAFNFTYNETNLNCSWYSVDDGSNTTSCSITGSEWTGTLTIASDGQHNITVWANDSAGNENSTVAFWIRDTAKPLVFVVFPQNNTIYNYSTLDLNVSSDDTEDGWRYDINGTGNVSFSPNTTITAAENVNNITVYVNDTAGNINSTIVYFTVDLTNPVIAIVVPDNITYASNPELNFSYTETRPDACWYSVKGSSNSTPASCDANITALTSDEGSNDVRLCMNDTSGRQGCDQVYYTKDTTKPVITIQLPLNQTYNLSSVWFNVTLNENGSSCLVDYGWGNKSMANTTGNWSYNNASMNDGSYQAIFYCNDTVGNLNSTNINFTVDTTKPVIYIQSPLNQTYDISSVWFNATLSENGSTCLVNYGYGNITMSNSSGDWNYNNVSMDDGSYQAVFYCNDTVGNLNTTGINFTVDTTKPAISIQFPMNQSYNTSSIWFNVTLSEAGDTCLANYGFGNNTMTNSTGNWNYQNSSMNEGSYQANFFCNDTVGNANTTNINFTVDLTNPAVSIVVPANTSYNYNPQLNFSYVETRPDACWYSLNGTANVTLASCNTNGTILISSQGSNNVRLCMNDTSSRQGCDQVFYTKDTVLPTITVVLPENKSYSSSNVWFNVTLDKVGDACLVDYGYGNKSLANASGNWNYNNASMNDGSYQAVFFCNDTVGNGNTTSIGFTLDTVYPYFSGYAHNPASPSEDQAVQVNVTLSETPDTVILEVNNGTKTNYTVATSNGLEYYFTVGTGNYTAHDEVNYTWFANDSVGNGNWSENQTFTVANQIPSVGAFNVNDTTPETNDAILCVNGSFSDSDAEDTEQNRGYRWYEGNNEVLGQSSQTLLLSVSGLDKGDVIKCSERVYDGYDWSTWVNSSNTATIQNTPPTAVSPILPPNGTLTSDSTPFFNWTSSTDADNDAITYTIEISTSLTFASISQANYTLNINNYTASSLSDNTYYWRAWAVTSDANSSTSGVFNLTIDTTPPLIFTISPANTTYNKSSLDLNVSSDGTEEGWKYNLNAAGNASFAPNTTITAAENANTIIVYVNDSLDNTNSTTVYFTVDLTNPVITISLPANISYPSNPQLNFSYTETRPDACWYSVNGTANVTLASCSTNGTVLISGEGSNNVRLCMNDTSGRQGCHQVYYTKDTTKPTITIQSPANMSYNLSSLWFNVTLDENGSACLVDFLTGNRSMDNSTGTWNLLNTTMPEGTFEAKFYCNDTVGNMNTTRINFTVDRTAPSSITIVVPADVSYNYNPQLNFSFYDLHPESCWYSLNQSANITLASCSTNGTVLSTGDGGQNVWLCVNDTAGNTGCSSTRYYTKDTIKPIITITIPPNSTTASDNFSFAYDHVNCSVYWVDGGSNVTNCSTAGLEWNDTLSLSDGPHNITVWANDSAGNTNSTTRYWRRDVDAPVITIVTPLETIYATDPQLNFSYVEANPDSCWYSFNGTANVTLASCETNGTVMVSGEGQNNVTICINDTSGKFGYDFVNYTKDSSSPVITINLPQNASYNVSSRSFNITISKVGGTCLVDYGYGNNTMTTATGLSWSYINSSMDEGVYQAKFFCNDSLGNSNTTGINFTIDATKPTIYIQTPLNQTYNVSSIWFNVTLSEPGSTCLVNYSSGNQTMTNSSGNWHYNASLSDGQYHAVFYCNDTAGNWNSTGLVYFGVDTTSPTITINNPINYTINSDGFNFSYGGLVNCSWYSVDGGTNTTNCTISTPWTGTLLSLSDDQHNITLWANDSAGNTNSTTRYWVRDTTPPLIFIVLPQNITYNTSTIRLNVSSDGSQYGWMYNLNGAGNQSFGPNTTITAQYGSNTIWVYVNDSTGNVNASSVTFYLNYTAPRIEFPNHTATGNGGWRETHTFYINCSDADGQNASLKLWYRRTPSDAWSLLGQQNCTSITPGTYFFNITTFGCSNVTPAGISSQFKFNATDVESLTNETLPQAFNITPYNVTVSLNSSSSANVSMLNATATLIFRIYDSSNGTYPSGIGGIAWIAENGASFSRALNCTTTDGFCTVSYKPNSSTSIIGTQYWKGASNESCYEYQNSTSQALEVTNPINATGIYPYAIINGSAANISVYVSGGYASVWANVTLPDSNVSKLMLTNNANTSFSQTSLTGRYNVTFYANDSSGNLVNSTGGYYFEAFAPVTLNLIIISSNSSGVNSSVTFYYRNESCSSNSSANGSFTGQIASSVFDIGIRGYADRAEIMLRSVNISYQNNRTFGMDKHTSISGYLVTYGINNTYNFSGATVTLYYDDTGYSNESGLQLHKCDSYDFTARSCSGSWSDVTSNATQNTTGHFFVINATSFSGFSVQQYAASPPSTPLTGTYVAPGTACTINWSCGSWGACRPDGKQTRVCKDMGTCKKSDKTETMICTYITPASCFDRMLNGDESDVDCGGPCLRQCENGKRCAADSDCLSGFCDDGACAARAKIPEETGGVPYGEMPKKIDYMHLTFVAIIIAILTIVVLNFTVMIRKYRALNKSKPESKANEGQKQALISLGSGRKN